MALFTDGPISSIEDLAAQDTQLENVANVEGIDVTQKLSLAHEEVGLRLEELLQASRRAEALFRLTPQATIRNIVVTPALKLWHTFRTLEMVYGDAYGDQLNDRYAAKRDQFQQRARRAYEDLLLLGIAIAWWPIARAGAPQVAATPGSLADGTYYVEATWTNSHGEEGAPSTVASVTTAGSTFTVQPAPAPAGVTGWNVYAGTDPGMLVRQNASPIGVAQAWVQPGTVTANGRPPGWGQSPNYHMAAPRMILRG